MAFRSRGVLGPRRPLRRARHDVRCAPRRARRDVASPTSRDFDPPTGPLADGSRCRAPATRRTRARSPPACATRAYTVASVESKPFTERPKAPFKTTTMQQEAGNKLRFSAGRTMSVAQGLYERGYITYMRTDSHEASPSRRSTRPAPRSSSGSARRTCRPRRARTRNKVKNAQEAHEAIRPPGTGSARRSRCAASSSRDEQPLYELIWMRTVASQMADARGRSVTLRLAGDVERGRAGGVPRVGSHDYEFLGFRMAYVDVSDEPERSRGRRGDPARGRRGRGRRAASGLEAERAHDPAAGALHRGEPGQGARGPRDRPAVDVRVDHQHDHERARLRLEEGQRARPVVDRVREDAAARALLPAPRRLRLHRHDGGGARRGRARRGRGREVAPHLLLRQRHCRAPRARLARRTSPRST